MNSVTTRRFLGGHYPNDLRNEFEEAMWEYRANQSLSTDRLASACRQVWHCTDCLPNDVFVYAQDIRGVEPKRRTYAALARSLHRVLRERAGAAGGKRRAREHSRN